MRTRARISIPSVPITFAAAENGTTWLRHNSTLALTLSFLLASIQPGVLYLSVRHHQRSARGIENIENMNSSSVLHIHDLFKN